MKITDMTPGFKAALMAVLLALPLTMTGASNSLDRSAEEVGTQIQAGSAPLLLDVRSVQEFESGHVPGAINIPVQVLADRLKDLEGREAETLIVYCEAGPRARHARWLLHGAGFEYIGLMIEHMKRWRAFGLPTHKI